MAAVLPPLPEAHANAESFLIPDQPHVVVNAQLPVLRDSLEKR